MAQTQTLFPANAKVLKISVSSSASTSTALPAIGNTICVWSDSGSTNTAFFSVGTGSQTATVPDGTTPVATCTPIMPGMCATFSIPNPQATPAGSAFTAPTPLNISAITAANTATIYVAVAEGM